MIPEKNQSSMTYAMIEECYGLNGIGRISYGIAVCADANVDGSATIVDAIHDITASRTTVFKHFDNIAHRIIAILHRFIKHTVACKTNSGGQIGSMISKLDVTKNSALGRIPKNPFKCGEKQFLCF